MREGWTYKKLGDLYPIIMGKTPPRGVASMWDTQKETNNLWVSIAELSKNEGKEIFETKEQISDEGSQNIRLIPKGALLLSFKLTLGKMAFAGKDLYTNEAIISLFDNDNFDLKYLYYYFSSLNWSELASGNEKVKGKTLNKKSLGEIPVATIPLSEQRAIVSRLDASFAHIDALKANAKKQLDDAKALFQKALEEAMKPKEGWEEKKLKEVVNSITDGDHQPPPKSHDGIPFITISDIDKNSNRINFEDTFFVPQDYFNSLKGDRTPQYGDVLYTVTGSFGIPVLIDFQKEFCFQRHIALIRPNMSLLSSTYLFFWILSSYAMSQAEDSATGAAQRTVSLNSLRNFTIHIPPLSEQQAIVAQLDQLSEKVKRLQEIQEKTIKECDALKQAILREVFE